LPGVTDPVPGNCIAGEGLKESAWPGQIARNAEPAYSTPVIGFDTTGGQSLPLVK